MDLKGKRILFICPNFHGYEKMIEDQLIELGGVVDFFPERSYGLDFTIVNNFFNRFLKNYQQLYYSRIENAIEAKHYDYLFVIRGFMLPLSFLQFFKKRNPKSYTIMYQWDSERTNPYGHLVEYFDVVKTFDYKDSEDFNISYLPLFYTKDLEKFRSLKKSNEFDFFFMGFFFEERYEAVLKFKIYCEQKGYKLKPFLYMPPTTRIKYFLKAKKLDRSIVSFKHMDRITYLKTLSNSRVMVDVSNSQQTGLAMRVIEALACGTKVLTNNTYVNQDDIIKNSRLISVIDMDNITIDETVFNESNANRGPIVHSLKEWAIKVFINIDES